MGPGGRPRRIDRSVGGNEVYGLVLDEFGLADAAERGLNPFLIAEWYGSLAPAADRHEVSRDLLAWLDGSTKIIVGGDGEIEIFDLERDPRETVGVEVDRGLRQEFWRRARDRWENLTPEDVTADLSAEALAKLRALGYLDECRVHYWELTRARTRRAELCTRHQL